MFPNLLVRRTSDIFDDDQRIIKGMIEVLENNQYIVYNDILDDTQEHSVQICEP